MHTAGQLFPAVPLIHIGTTRVGSTMVIPTARHNEHHAKSLSNHKASCRVSILRMSFNSYLGLLLFLLEHLMRPVRIELTARTQDSWRCRWELNPVHGLIWNEAVYKSAGESRPCLPPTLVNGARIELAASVSSGLRSRRLSYPSEHWYPVSESNTHQSDVSRPLYH